MTTRFTGVLVTAHSKMKHLLVNMETRRSVCGDNFRSGQRTEGTDTWNEPGPIQCPKCAAKYAEWEKQNGQSKPKQRSVAMSKITKSESIRRLKPYTRMLPCKLTKDELLGYGADLAQVRQDILTEEARQVSLKQQLKASLTELESRSLLLSSKVARREEARDVEVEPQLDFKAGEYCEVRRDTGEKISQRPVTEEERQENILFEKPEPKKRTSKTTPPPDKGKSDGARVS